MITTGVSRQREYALLSMKIWGSTGLIAGLILVYFGYGIAELLLATTAGIISGFLWGVTSSCTHVDRMSVIRSTRPETIVDVADTQDAEFHIQINPKLARAAAGVWFWRMQRKFRIREMIGSAVLGLILAWVMHAFQYETLAAIFILASVLAIAYFPIFYFVFQVEAANRAKEVPRVDIILSRGMIKVIAGEHETSIHLANLNYIEERDEFFLLSYQRYGWLCLPKVNVPDAAQKLFRAHSRYSRT